jgi:hypothetical protein
MVITDTDEYARQRPDGMIVSSTAMMGDMGEDEEEDKGDGA